MSENNLSTTTVGSQATLTSYMVGDTNENDTRKKSFSTILNLSSEKYPPTNGRKGSIKTRIIEKTRRSCTKKLLYKRLPFLVWLPNYNLEYAIADLIAGFTVGLTVVCQGLAYSNITGLPVATGLYSCFMGSFMYVVFGSCKEAPIGPSAISALLTRENIHNLGVDGASLLTFVSGCVEFLMGILQLGFLIDFISGPVSVGFTSAAAIIIATTQVKDILGISCPGSTFLDIWDQVFQHISETKPGDCALGVTSLVVLFILRSVKNIRIGPENVEEQTPFQKTFNKIFFFVSLSRNIIVVIFATIAAFVCDFYGQQPFAIIGYIKPGMPEFKPPAFYTEVNGTRYDFVDMTSSIGSGFIVVPLLIILENIALAKVFANGLAIDATQEMLALGACNIMSSFVQSIPVTGALARGAVNHASGVKTPFGGVYTGIIVLLCLQLLTTCFSYIPKASLAAVIIAAAVFMIEFQVVKPMWKTKKTDLIPAIVTFVLCLFIRLEIGIAVGIGVNLLFLLYATARPSVHVQKILVYPNCEYLLITPDRSLAFPSVEYVRGLISKAGVRQGSSSIPVVIDAKHIQGADFTAAKGIKSLTEDFQERNQPIYFYNLKQSVVNVFEGVRPRNFVYCKTSAELHDLLRKNLIKDNVNNTEENLTRQSLQKL